MVQHVTLLVLGTTTSSATAAVAILVRYEAYWRFSLVYGIFILRRELWLGSFLELGLMLNEGKEQADRNERGNKVRLI